MNIYMVCAWPMGTELQYAKYIEPAHRMIEAYARYIGEILYITPTILADECWDLLKAEALRHPYSRDAFAALISSRESDANVVVGVNNGRAPYDKVLRLAVGPVGCGMNTCSITCRGDMPSLYAMQPLMLLAADEFSADYARVLDGDVINRFAINRTRSNGGELAYIRRSEIVEVEGFTAQRHGDGVLYVMDRAIAESGVEERAAAILRLQPLYDSLA